jgi:hypothetical protein
MSQLKPFEKYYVDCVCDCAEHVIRFVYNPNDTSQEDEELGLWMEVQLPVSRTLWERIRLGIKYILGHGCPFGYWSCTSFTERTGMDLIVILAKAEMKYGNLSEEEFFKKLQNHNCKEIM